MCLDPRNILLNGYSGHILREIKQPGREADYLHLMQRVNFFFEYIVTGSRYEVSVTVRFVEDILGSRRVKC